MGAETGISWVDATWNPGVGCQKVSAGCRNCYMYRDMARYGRDGRDIHRTSEATFQAPLKHRRDGAWAWPDGLDVFTASWSDWWLDEWDGWRSDAWDVIRRRPGLRFLILTKRPERITRERLPADWPLPNVLLGVSVEDAANVWRVEALRRVADRWGAPGLFVSAEPLLGSLAGHDAALRRVDWIVAGGESGGAAARPAHPDWFRGLRDLGRRFHFKQWGRYAPASQDLLVDLVAHPERRRGRGNLQWAGPTVIVNRDGGTRPGTDDAVNTWRDGDQRMVAVGERRAGRVLDGVMHDERPERPA